jgi:hypothetical protein
MIKPTPGSGAPKAENQLPPSLSSDIIERTTAKRIEAPSSPHAVTVIHACRNHQRCSADPGLGFMARLCANRDSHIRASAQSSLRRLLGNGVDYSLEEVPAPLGRWAGKRSVARDAGTAGAGEQSRGLPYDVGTNGKGNELIPAFRSAEARSTLNQ